MSEVIVKKTAGWQVLTYLTFLFLMILIPTYLHYYGPQNFLWLSDMGLFLTCLALWLNKPVLMSMAAVGVLVLELIWCFDFFAELLFNINPIDLSDYMFNASLPILLRAISLFHVATPIIWVRYLWQFGYDKRALNYFIALYWVVLMLTYQLTDPVENINWVFMPKVVNMGAITPVAWLLIMIIGFPLLLFWPTHLCYKKFFKIR